MLQCKETELFSSYAYKTYIFHLSHQPAPLSAVTSDQNLTIVEQRVLNSVTVWLNFISQIQCKIFIVHKMQMSVANSRFPSSHSQHFTLSALVKW